MSGVFDYIATINKKSGKNPTTDPDDFDKEYNQFLVNRNFSYYIDTVLFANEMNIRSTPEHGISGKTHFQYLYNNISKSNRYEKWSKPDKSDVIDILSKYYKYSIQKSKEVVDLFTDEDINELKKKMYEGGNK